MRKRLACLPAEVGAALLLCAALCVGAPAHAAERALLLEVYINGTSTAKLQNFTERAGQLYATRADLEELGLIVSPHAAQAADGMIDVAALGAQPYWLDERAQALYLVPAAGSLKPTLLSTHGADPKAAPPLDTGRGAVLNYDAVITHTSGGGQAASALLDARAFAPQGTITSGTLVQSSHANGAPTVLRLDTTFTHADPATLKRTSAGDFISSGVAWSRPVRMAGVQFGTDFALRPDLVTMPMPRLAGETAVPSTVDVMVNGVRQLTQNVNPGPFEVRQIPVPVGVGEIAVAVQDALGRQTVQRLPFYGSSRLLGAGQSAWTVEAGLVRKNYGLRSWDYGRAAAAGSWRYGVDETLTVEGHAELAEGAGNAGAGVYYGMGQWGMVSAAIASNLDGRGLQTTVGYERVSRSFSFAASMTQAQASRHDIASSYGDAVSRYVSRVSASLPMGFWGTVSAAVAQTRAGAGVVSNAATSQPALAGETTLRTLTYTRGLFGSTQLFLTAYNTTRPEGSNSGFFAGVSFTLDGGIAGGASVTNNGSGGSTFTQQAMRPAVATGDLGWQAQVSEGQYRRFQGEAEYRLPYAHLTAGVDQLNNQTSVRAGVRGALATVDGATSISGPIQGSFAIIDTDGRPDVPVLVENRNAGSTDARGLLTLTQLRAYDANRIAIDPLSVDSDVEFKSPTMVVRPADRAGARVKFPMHQVTAALIVLVDESGAWLPLGSEVQQADGARAPVGHEGQAYIGALAADNRLQVRLPGGRHCLAAFPYTTSKRSGEDGALTVVCGGLS